MRYFIVLCAVFAALFAEGITAVHYPTADGVSVDITVKNYTISLQGDVSVVEAGVVASPDGIELPVWTGIVAVPSDGSVRTEMVVEKADTILSAPASARPGINTPKEQNETFTRALGSMRGIHIAVVGAYLANTTADGQFVVVRRARLDIHIDGNFAVKMDSPAFTAITDTVLLNHADIPKKRFDYAGVYLVIYPELLADVAEQWANYRRSMGYFVYLVPTDDMGLPPDSASMRAYIADAYDNWYPRPDMVLLLGDVNLADGSVLPHYGYQEGFLNYSSDHGYTLTDGDDYISDMLLGRIAVDNATEAQTAFNKLVSYELSPSETPSGWMDRGLCVATYLHAISPPLNTLWVRELLLRYGFTSVDTLFESTHHSVPASEISSAINGGVAYVDYRGWGGSNGWWEPGYTTSDVMALSNTGAYPVVTSVVCGTVDFAGLTDPCFGEAWIRAGTPENPKGGVAVFGPSDHDTHTRENNPLNTGFYQSIFGMGLDLIGQAMLVAKLNQFLYIPLERDTVGKHYAYVYNILGDPSTAMWAGAPSETLSIISAPDTIRRGGEMVRVSVLPATKGVRVSIYREADDAVVSNLTSSDGSVEIAVPAGPSSWGDITATKRNCLPARKRLYFRYYDYAVLSLTGVRVNNPDSALAQGTESDVYFHIRNNGEEITDILLYAAAENDELQIPTPTLNIATISTGEQWVGPIRLGMDIGITNRHYGRVVLVLERRSETRYLLNAEIPVASPAIAVTGFTLDDGADGILDPGETATVYLQLDNSSAAPAESLVLTAIATNGFVGISDGSIAVSHIDGESAITTDDGFVITGFGYAGAVGSITVKCGDTRIGIIDIPIGGEGSDRPGTPDKYGYIAYDDTDSGAVIPDWFEIDGIGDELYSSDDATVAVALSEPFVFYGQSYDSISVCSNGWIAPGKASRYLIDFYNLPLPSAGGPFGTIAPFWDDLQPGTSGRLLFYENDTIAVVEWNDFRHTDDAATAYTFQVQIRTGSSSHTGDTPLAFVYFTDTPDIDSAQCYSTVGIESPDQLDGVQELYSTLYAPDAAPLSAGRRILFTTDCGMGTLEGMVGGDCGELPADVVLRNDLGQVASVASDGEFRFRDVPVGARVFVASAPGYFPDSFSISVSPNTLYHQDFTLELVPIPSGFTASKGGTSLELSWDAVSAAGHALTGYRVLRRDAPSGVWSVSADIPATEFTDTLADGYRRWWYSVESVFDGEVVSLPAEQDSGWLAGESVSDAAHLPMDFGLTAYPNPFNSSVKITVGQTFLSVQNGQTGMSDLPVTVEIYDLRGHIVGARSPRPVREGTETVPLQNGASTFIWQPDKSISSGIYLIRATVGGQTNTKRVILMK